MNVSICRAISGAMEADHEARAGRGFVRERHHSVRDLRGVGLLHSRHIGADGGLVCLLAYIAAALVRHILRHSWCFSYIINIMYLNG